MAAQNGHLSMVQYLLEHGADMEKLDDYGLTPMDVAATEEIKELIREKKRRVTEP